MTDFTNLDASGEEADEKVAQASRPRTTFDCLVPNSGDGVRNCPHSAEKATPMEYTKQHLYVPPMESEYSSAHVGQMIEIPFGGRCPESEQIVTFAMESITDDTTEAICEHVSTCSNCRIEVEALRQALEELRS